MKCSFCNADQSEVWALVRNGRVVICYTCVNRAIATLLLAGEIGPFRFVPGGQIEERTP
jgi:hypothetical protein